MMTKKSEYWVTNISKLVITVNDLNFTIYPKQSFNLLRKNSEITLDKIKLSQKSGDLSKKKNFLAFGESVPKKIGQAPIEFSDGAPSTCRYHYEEIIEQNLISDDYDNLADEKFIDELIEIEDEK